MMNNQNDTVKRLETLNGGDTGAEGGPDGSAPGNTEEAQARTMEAEKVANMVIEYANRFFSDQGLSPLNPVQSLLLRAGIVGTANKYGLSFDMNKYPELALIASAAWITLDKVKEYKAKKPATEPDKKETDTKEASAAA